MQKHTLKLCILFLSLLFTINLIYGWVARYNGPGNGDDYANAIALDGAGNVYVTGYCVGPNGNNDYATVKYNSAGVEQWVAYYNGPRNLDDWANAIAVDNVGNVYVTGASKDSSDMAHNICDYATVKYDASGLQQWVVRYNGPDDENDRANAITVDDAGNVYVTGGSNTDWIYYPEYATVKYDSMGVEQWVSRSPHGKASDIAIDEIGNVYVTGTLPLGIEEGHYATVKYDSLGVEQWVVTCVDPGWCDGAAFAIGLDSACNVHITGKMTDLWNAYTDYVTVKYDSSGVEQWRVRYDFSNNDRACALAVDRFGYVYVTGRSIGFGSSSDYATIKYDSMASEQWVIRYNGSGNAGDGASAIALDSVGAVYVTGTSAQSVNWPYNFDYATVKYDSYGAEQWVALYNGPGNGDDEASAIATDGAGYVYVTGGSEGSGTGVDYATIKYAPTGNEEQSNVKVTTRCTNLSPTIFSGPLVLPEGKHCRVFDITGRVVARQHIKPGVYFIESDGQIVQKVIKVK